MLREQLAIGLSIVGLCLVGWLQQAWLLTHSRMARALVNRLGPVSGPRMLQTLLIAGMIFGGLLATDCIRPVRWN